MTALRRTLLDAKVEELGIQVGDTLRAFDPATLGVVKHCRVQSVGRFYVHVDFGLTGRRALRPVDVVENLGRQGA